MLAALVGIRLIPEEDIELEDIEKGQVPCIALWDDAHYIIIAEIRDEEIIVVDPALGPMRVNKELAARRFSGLIRTKDHRENLREILRQQAQTILSGFQQGHV